MMGLSLGRFPVSALRQRGAGLNFAALPALPANRQSAVTTAANAAAATLGVSAQSIVDALAVGRGLASLLPNDGCLLASSGGTPTVQGDPVEAIRSWTGVELATQNNASLLPVSGIKGVVSTAGNRMNLGNLSAWTSGEILIATEPSYGDSSGSGGAGADRLFQIGTAVFAPHLRWPATFTDFGVTDRFSATAPAYDGRLVILNQHFGAGILVYNWNNTQILSTAATLGFSSSASLFNSNVNPSGYNGSTSAMALNSNLYTADQRAAVREFCRNYYGVVY